MPDQRSVMKEFRSLERKLSAEGLSPSEEARLAQLRDLIGPELGVGGLRGGFDVSAAAARLRESLLPAGLRNRPPPEPAQAPEPEPVPELSPSYALASAYDAEPFAPLEAAETVDALFEPSSLEAAATYDTSAEVYDPATAGYDAAGQGYEAPADDAVPGWDPAAQGYHPGAGSEDAYGTGVPQEAPLADEQASWEPPQPFDASAPELGAPYDPNAAAYDPSAAAAYDPSTPAAYDAGVAPTWSPDAPLDPGMPAAWDPNAPFDPAAYPAAPYDPNAAAAYDAGAPTAWDPNVPLDPSAPAAWDPNAPFDPSAYAAPSNDPATGAVHDPDAAAYVHGAPAWDPAAQGEPALAAEGDTALEALEALDAFAAEPEPGAAALDPYAGEPHPGATALDPYAEPQPDAALDPYAVEPHAGATAFDAFAAETAPDTVALDGPPPDEGADWDLSNALIPEPVAGEHAGTFDAGALLGEPEPAAAGAPPLHADDGGLPPSGWELDAPLADAAPADAPHGEYDESGAAVAFGEDAGLESALALEPSLDAVPPGESEPAGAPALGEYDDTAGFSALAFPDVAPADLPVEADGFEAARAIAPAASEGWHPESAIDEGFLLESGGSFDAAAAAAAPDWAIAGEAAPWDPAADAVEPDGIAEPVPESAPEPFPAPPDAIAATAAASAAPVDDAELPSFDVDVSLDDVLLVEAPLPEAAPAVDAGAVGPADGELAPDVDAAVPELSGPAPALDFSRPDLSEGQPEDDFAAPSAAAPATPSSAPAVEEDLPTIDGEEVLEELPPEDALAAAEPSLDFEPLVIAPPPAPAAALVPPPPPLAVEPEPEPEPEPARPPPSASCPASTASSFTPPKGR